MNKLLLLALLVTLSLSSSAQVGISNDGSQPDPSAALEVKFTDKGLLPPRLNTIQRDAISAPARGLVIFNLDCNDLQLFNGTGWVPIGNVGYLSGPGNITGNPATCPGTQGVAYSVQPVAGAEGYSWTVPPGAVIATGQGTPAVTVNFGAASGSVCVVAYNSCSKSTLQCMPVTLGNSAPVSVVVTPSTDTICAGTSVSYATSVANGGTNPGYTWYVNGMIMTGASSSTYTCIPVNGDQVTCKVTSNQLCASNNPATSSPVTLQVLPVLPTSVTIAASANPACSGAPVIFTPSPVNGGNAPLFTWKVNGVIVSTGASLQYTPLNGDAVTCVMTSSLPCSTGNPATSNTITLSVIPVATSPATAGNSVTQTSVTWQWHPVAGATGYKWNTSNNAATAVNVGSDTLKAETGLTCGTAYTRYVWASNSCFTSIPATLTQSTAACTYPCASSVTVTHVAGAVAPVGKIVTYYGVSGVAGEPSKCWITANLGSDHQAGSVSDASEASAGWYWQFNRKQGYKHDGSAPLPTWTITGIFENSDWLPSNDPCSLELGTIWRIPTQTEWANVDNAGGWTNWNVAWNSPLKLHASGLIGYSSGDLYSRGSSGYFWSSTKESNSNGHGMTIYSGGSYVNPYNKAYGIPLRCLHD
ncbi:MAG TPA: hypothetical protein PLK82_06250 [Bacteroidales bacterium]|nr:hypothetical protein [Bacteroidales bacterium]